MDNTAGDEKHEKRLVAELKNGKVVFKQKPMTFEKNSETMSETIKFREMLEDRIARRDTPLPVFPDEHKPLIAKLGHESDKTASALAKHIRGQLLPTLDDDDINSDSTNVAASLPLPILESAITSILSRINYGLDNPTGIARPPAAVCIWRWEVKSEHREWLPKALREKIDARRSERVQAKEDLQALFEALTQEERDKIFDPKRAVKLPTKDSNQDSVSPSKPIEPEPQESPQQVKKQQKNSENVENDAALEASTSKVGPGRPKKEVDPEKLAKEKERLEKKAAKAEKEKKAKEAQIKSRSLMATFFSKPKVNNRESPTTDSDVAIASKVAGPSSSQTAFEKTFKPFVVKKDADVAPTNWFLRKNKAREVILIDDEDFALHEEETVDRTMQDTYSGADLGQLTATEHIRAIISTMPPSADSLFTTAPRRRLYAPRVVTRDIIAQLNEAEIADDPSRVRSLLSVLRNRRALPAKVLIFHEDARPGYFGTWTRHSKAFGPTTHLNRARDPIAMEYDYDSGQEWEDEGNDNADDVHEGADDDDVASEADSDLDSWLVSDDEIEEIPAPSADSEVEVLATLNFPSKRKADDGERKIGKKRKVVVPLVPFVKGPCWETSVGQCSYEPFESYRIQLFNDTPYPIDPFTFVSVDEQQVKVAKESATASTFAVPSLPNRILTPGNIPSTQPLAPIGQMPQTKRAHSAQTPKTAFPDAHLPTLTSKINALATGSFILLVETVFQDLRDHKVKKNAIEAKIKEIAEKSKDKKIWVLKSTTPVISQS